MANLDAATAAEVSAVKIIETFTGPAEEALDAGDVVRLNTTTGYITHAKDTGTAEARVAGILLNTVAINRTGTVLRCGVVDIGDIFGDLDYDDDVYLSATDGRLADAAVTAPGTSKVVGEVVPSFGNTTADKLLRVDL